MAAESHQERLYHLLDQLQRMARELPTKYVDHEYSSNNFKVCFTSRYQQRIPYDLLAELAASLAQGQIFEIVKMLTEVINQETGNWKMQKLQREHELNL